MQDNSNSLKKDLNLIEIFSIASGAMISSGIFILPGLAYAKAGPGIIISYLLGGLVALIGLISIAELATAMPKAGGDYFFIARSLGPCVGTISGLLSWIALSLKSAFAIVGIAEILLLVTSFNLHYAMIVICVIFVVLNLFGVKEAGKTQVILVAGLLGIILVYFIFGVPNVQLHRFQNLMPNGFFSVIATTGFIFVSYGGLIKIASIAEEVNNPQRNIPLGLILALVFTSALYSAIVLIIVGTLDGAQLASSYTPVSDSAKVFMGTAGEIILSIAAILAFTTTANAGILSASRYPLALSRDKLLPPVFGLLSKKHRTPYIALLLTGAIVVIAIYLNIDFLIKAASAVLILNYILSCVSVIILRESRIQTYKPSFKSPLYPYLQIIGIICFFFLIYEMGAVAVLTSLGLVLAGLVIYLIYGRINSNKEFAFMHIVERITSKEITSHFLETELREIIRERDNIIEDRFDELVSRSIVLDIQEKSDCESVFSRIASALAVNISLPSESIEELLSERERESGTAISPVVAIPHIIIPGQKNFTLLLARAKQGVFFSEEYPSIKAIFVLAGTKDERNFHLKALSAIAQTVSDKSFDDLWMKAKNEHALRDIFLLAERSRFR